jgi:hypothetical protein
MEMKKNLFVAIIVLLMCSGAIVHADLAPLVNASFDDQAVSPYLAGVRSWSGVGHTTVNPATWGISPSSAHNGDNAVTLNSDGGYIYQHLMDTDGSNILIEANQTYTVTLWAGRITGQSEFPPLLVVGLQETVGSSWDIFTYEV